MQIGLAAKHASAAEGLNKKATAVSLSGAAPSASAGNLCVLGARPGAGAGVRGNKHSSLP